MKKNRTFHKITSVIAATLAMSCILASCGSSGSAASGASSSAGSASSSASASGKTIKIGSIAPLTGNMAAEGQAMVNAQQIAVDEINEVGGISSLGGAKLELVTGDSQGAADTGASEAERLIDQEGCVALTGTYQSSVTETASQKAEQAGIPFLVDVSSATSLGQREFSTFFRLQPTSDEFGAETIKMISEVKPDDVSTCVIIHEDSVNGTSVAQSLADNLNQAGLTLLDNISYSASATTMDSEVTKLASEKPDLLFDIGYYTDSSLLFKTCNEKNVTFKMVVGVANGGISEASFMSEFGNTCENFLNVNYALNPNSEVAQKLSTEYQDKYGEEIINHAGLAYDSVKVIAAALESAGSTDGKTLCGALKNLDYPEDQLAMAFDGDVDFDDTTGENVNASLCLVQDQGGKAVVVYPEKFAAAQIQYNN